jgi:hypothetical protein
MTSNIARAGGATPMTRVRLLLLGLLLSALTGCGDNLPPAASPDKAREVLTTSFEAWKNGETAQSLTAREQPIYFNDPRWEPGTRVVSYAIDESHEMYGQSVRLTGTMTVKQADGAAKERKFNYLIDTAPAIVIVPG